MQVAEQPLSKKVSRPFKIYQVLVPVLLGLFVIGWLFLDEDEVYRFALEHVEGENK